MEATDLNRSKENIAVSDNTTKQGATLEPTPPSSTFLQCLCRKVDQILTERNYWRVVGVSLILISGGQFIPIFLGIGILWASQGFDDEPIFGLSKLWRPAVTNS